MQTDKSVDAYIHAQPEAIAHRLEHIRSLFYRLVPDAKETISYGIMAFSVGKTRLYVSAYSKHIGMYPMYGLSSIEDNIAPYRGKGTKDALHFTHNQPIPYDLIELVIAEKMKRAHK